MLWRGHAVQLRRLKINGKTCLVYQGSLTQILYWLRTSRGGHLASKRKGRLWIEDIAEPARVLSKFAGSR